MTDLAITRRRRSGAAARALHVSLSRVGVTGVEKVIRIGRTAPSNSSTPSSTASSTSGPRQKGAHMSRFEEVVNEAIDEVVLGEALPGRDARRAHRRARARAPGRAARRGDDRGALPRAQARAGLGHRDAGDLHAVRLRGRVRARHAPARRRRRAGHDRVPVRAGARHRRARASGCSADGFTDDEIERIFEAVPVATHNQRGLGTLYVGCPEGCDDRHRRARAAARSSRSRCARRSTS